MALPSSRSSKSRAATRIKRVVGILLSGALLWWLIHIADLHKVSEHLAHVPPTAIILTILFGYIAIPLRVIQWQLLLSLAPEATFCRVLNATCVGYLGNFLLPMRGGELVRAYLLAKQTGLSTGRVLVSVFLSRLQDLPPVGVLAAIVFGVIPISPTAIQRTMDLMRIPIPNMLDASPLVFRALGISALCAVVGIYVVYIFADTLLRWLERKSGAGMATVRRLVPFLRGIKGGVNVIGNARMFWGAQSLSFLCWLVYALSPIPLLMAFSMTLTQALLAAIAKAAITTVSSILPSAPGTIGTFHAFCLLSLLIVNPAMDKDVALAYVFIAHLISTLSPALPGLIFLPSAWNDMLQIGKSRADIEMAADPASD